MTFRIERIPALSGAVVSSLAQTARPCTRGCAARLPGIEVESAIRRFAGNESLLVELVGDMRSRFAGAPAAMRASIAKGRFEEAEAVAHALRGVSANLSARRVSSDAKTLETLLRTGGDTAELETALGGLESALAELDAAGASVDVAGTRVEAAGAGLAADPAASAVRRTADAGSEVSLPAALAELSERVAKGRLDALEVFETLRPSLFGLGVDAAVARLGPSLSSLDFAAAGNSLEEIREALSAQGAPGSL